MCQKRPHRREIFSLWYLHHPNVEPEVCLNAQKNKLTHLDKMSFVDLEYISHVRGEAGQKRLEDIFCQDCLSSESNYKTAEEAVKNADKLMEGELYAFVGSAAQGSIEAAHKMISAVATGKAPVAVPQPTPFLTCVWARLPFFFKKDPTGQNTDTNASDSSSNPGLFGVKALEAQWNDISKVDEDKLELASFQDLEIFAAWLTSSTRDEIAKLKTAVIRKSCRKFKAGQAKVLRPEGRKRKAKDADIQAEDAAKALLGI